MSEPRPFSIGIIAPEFPPDIGGMHTLARTDHVRVYSPNDRPALPGTYEQKVLLTGRLAADAQALAAEPIDTWIALNAGLLPLLRRLGGRRFVYVHGKDFLTPWIACGPAWIEAFQRVGDGDDRPLLEQTARDLGVADAAEDGHNGILIPESSPEPIAAKIRRFVTERAHFSESTVRAWAELFRWPRVAAQFRAALTATPTDHP